MILYITSGFTYAALCKRLHKAAIWKDYTWAERHAMPMIILAQNGATE